MFTKKLSSLIALALVVGALVPRIVPALGGGPTTVVCNGSGQNPLILSERFAPEVGKPWQVNLDCTTAAVAKPAIFVLSFVAKPSPIPSRWGEILVGLGGGTGTSFTRLHASSIVPLTATIPSDPGFACQSFQVQGFCGDDPRGYLSNALASTIGP